MEVWTLISYGTIIDNIQGKIVETGSIFDITLTYRNVLWNVIRTGITQSYHGGIGSTRISLGALDCKMGRPAARCAGTNDQTKIVPAKEKNVRD